MTTNARYQFDGSRVRRTTQAANILRLTAQVSELQSLVARICEHLSVPGPRAVADGIEYVTPKQAMHIADCSRSAVQKMVTRKKDPVRSIKVGNRVLIESDSLMAYLRRKQRANGGANK